MLYQSFLYTKLQFRHHQLIYISRIPCFSKCNSNPTINFIQTAQTFSDFLNFIILCICAILKEHCKFGICLNIDYHWNAINSSNNISINTIGSKTIAITTLIVLTTLTQGTWRIWVQY